MSELLAAFEKLARPRVLVVGDIILDRYSWGNAERVSPEAPVLVLKVDRREVRLGGAASVAHLLRCLEAEVVLVGVIGNDASGRTTSQLLNDAQIDASEVMAIDDRPTTSKERFIGRAAGRHPCQILRVDDEISDPVDKIIEDRLLAAIDSEISGVKAVLVSDYAKGVCTPRLLRSLIDRSRANKIPVIIDPARDVDFSRYRNATLIKPNRIEAAHSTGMSIETPSDAIQAAFKLIKNYDIASAVVTVDCDGMVLATSDGQSEHVPTVPREIYDITGAGDMALAIIGLGLASEIPLASVVRLGNVAASLEVERLGVTPISRIEIREAIAPQTSSKQHKLVTLSQAKLLADAYRNEGQRIVVTNGCFDLLHAGHVKCLRQSATFGDVLFVAINSDTSVRRLKGPSRPIYNEADRIEVLSAIKCVSHVLVFDEETPHHLLEQIRPDVLTKGGTYSEHEVVGREVVISYGGQVCVTEMLLGESTTSTILRCQAADSITQSSVR